MVLDILVIDGKYAQSISGGLSGQLEGVDSRDIRFASSGEEALSMVKDRHFSFVVLNHEFGNGGMDGYDTALALKKIREDIVLIGFSGGWMDSDIKRYGLGMYTRYLDRVAKFILEYQGT